MVQEGADELVQRNPPSSGLLGTVLMMSLCELVHVYEFLPSQRQSNQCHYYQDFSDEACTLGAYHPLLFEKNLVRRMNYTYHLAGQKTDKAAGNRVKKIINQHKMHHEKAVILDVGAKMKETGKWLDHRWRKTHESD
ncbi:hypothetical protein Chor_006045 [Crotalus horridus]